MEITITTNVNSHELEAHEAAWKFFWPEGNGKAKPGYVLHHIDPSWRHEDPERYAQWRPEDLVMMTNSDHTKLHHRKGEKTGKKWWHCTFPKGLLDPFEELSETCPDGYTEGRLKLEDWEAYSEVKTSFERALKKLKQEAPSLSKVEKAYIYVLQHAESNWRNPGAPGKLSDKAYEIIKMEKNNLFEALKSAVCQSSRSF